MLKSILQYKIFVLAFIFFNSFNCFSITKKDSAVFRIGENVLFLSDVRKITDQFSFFQCTYKHGLMFDGLSIDFDNGVKENLKSIQAINRQNPLSRESIDYFNKLKTLIKLKIYSSTQNIVLDSKLVTTFLKKAQKKKCIVPDNLSELALKDLLKVEILLHSKFSIKNISNLDLESKKNRIESLNLFISTIERQISHENYW